MKTSPYLISDIKTIDNVCYVEQRWHSTIFELEKSNPNFCLFFTALARYCFAGILPDIESRNVTILAVDVRYIGSILRLSDYKEKEANEIKTIEKIKGKVSYIFVNESKLTLKLDGSEQRFFFTLEKEYLVHWVYNIAYSYKHGSEIEIEIVNETDKHINAKEIINIKPNVEMEKAL